MPLGNVLGYARNRYALAAATINFAKRSHATYHASSVSEIELQVPWRAVAGTALDRVVQQTLMRRRVEG